MNKKSSCIAVLLIGNQGTRIINIDQSITGKKTILASDELSRLTLQTASP